MFGVGQTSHVLRLRIRVLDTRDERAARGVLQPRRPCVISARHRAPGLRSLVRQPGARRARSVLVRVTRTGTAGALSLAACLQSIRAGAEPPALLLRLGPAAFTERQDELRVRRSGAVPRNIDGPRKRPREPGKATAYGSTSVDRLE